MNVKLGVWVGCFVCVCVLGGGGCALKLSRKKLKRIIGANSKNFFQNISDYANRISSILATV